MKVKMLVVQGRPAGKNLIFPVGDYYIGRGAECHVRPNSELVSRQHCVLRVTPAGVYLRDLGSRNGTLVNGTLLSAEKKLQPGDRIQVGPLVFEVSVITDGSEPRDGQGAPSRPDLAPADAPTEPASLDSTDNLPILPPAPERPRNR